MIANLRPATRIASAIVALLVLVVWTAGCGSGGGSGTAVIPDGLTAQFSGSGATSAADRIRINGSAAADLVTIEVVIGGPTTSGDLYSFAFDLVLSDPTVAEYVDGSASVGTALTTSDGQALQALAVQQDERITVGVSKIGGGPGNGVTGTGEATVVQLVFRLLRAGSTNLMIAGSPGSDPAAIDSAGGEIETVAFDPNAATLLAI